MPSKKDKQTDILNNINHQFKELIDLIEQEKDFSFSMKCFDSLKAKEMISTRKWFILSLFILFASVLIYFILLNDELTYNIYFLCLSFIRLILINVRRIF